MKFQRILTSLRTFLRDITTDDILIEPTRHLNGEQAGTHITLRTTRTYLRSWYYERAAELFDSLHGQWETCTAEDGDAVLIRLSTPTNLPEAFEDVDQVDDWGTNVEGAWDDRIAAAE